MSEENAHSLYAPSGAHKWIPCPGALDREKGLPNGSSVYAEEGTAAHELGSMSLKSGKDTSAYIGRILNKCKIKPEGFEVDSDMADYVQEYVMRVLEYADDGALLVEQRVDFSTHIDVPGQTGTADAVIISNDGEEIQVHDLKYGKGNIVHAEENPQLMLYALGALFSYGMLGNFKHARMVIHQPRLNHLSEWDCSVEELLAFAKTAKAATKLKTINPGPKQCQWCGAKATCLERAEYVGKAIIDDFDNIEDLTDPKRYRDTDTLGNDVMGTLLPVLDMIADWCNSLRSRAEHELAQGNEVPGYKLVQGKKGNRAWGSADEVEKAMKAMRLKKDEMYTFKLISPTVAEKLLKKDTPKRWATLNDLVTQADGKPAVVPFSDKREAITISAKPDEFDNLEADASDLM